MDFILSKEKKIKKLLAEHGYEFDSFSFEESSRPEYGMYQYNGAMELAKVYHKNPRDIAQDIVKIISSDKDLVNINIQGPGFINFSFSNESLVKYMNDVLNDFEHVIEKRSDKLIVLDYGGPNVAKTLHVGHLRSANIGEALKRLATSCGYKVISDVHLGDFGRQMGLIILEIKKRYPELPYFDDSFTGEYPTDIFITNQDLETLYPIASARAKEDEMYLEDAREITALLQKGHRGYTALWKYIVDISVKDIKKLYDLIGANFDYWYGESDANQYMPVLYDYLKQKGVLEESQGAVIIDVSLPDDKKEIPPFIFIKSNGSVSYEATDLACIYQRQKDFHPDEIWYVVDNRQELHFVQTFRAAYRSTIIPKDVKLEFLGFGTMNSTDGKPFKTRDGGVMSLRNLIDLVKDECMKHVSDNVSDKENVAMMVAMASLKYADLLTNRSKDYVFDVEKFCDVQGKTGAYLLYSTVRIKSLLNKANVNQYRFVNLYNEYDEKIVLEIIKLNEVVHHSLSIHSLNEICDYLYRLNNSYNSFYNEIHILTEEDKDKRDSFLALSKTVYDINLFLLDILAIRVPDKM